MKACWNVVLVMLIAGGGATYGMERTPAPGALPAKKKELPWIPVPGGRMKTTLFYGPWQCNQRFMTSCQRECALKKPALKKPALMGCMWLADIKLEWEGRLIVPPLPVEAGTRYAIWHCCCNYTELSKEENSSRRDAWDDFRDVFREEWSRKFGEWPIENGEHWPGHHIHDLKHGGPPTDRNNILPVPSVVHSVLNREYPACYSGKGPWSTVGPDLPYRDN
jgi:hypothetical protein